jgi:signal peptidase I
MISWWKTRRTLKHAREFSRGARKMLRVQRDLLDPARAAEVAAAGDELDAAIRARNLKAVEVALERVEQRLERTVPATRHHAIRENVEVFLVAAIVAMAIRTFFLQPFKIPTGSMQPTLYGIFPAPDREAPLAYQAGPPDPIARLFGMAFLGRIYETFGYRTRGDHIFVDKISYHFRKPQRGEVVVFDTQHIPELPAGSRGKFYIKRLIGVARDRLRIVEPHVLVNDQVLDSRPAFKRIYSCRDGYNGYVLPGRYAGARYFKSPIDEYVVPDKHLFVMGDNSRASLDGRYWGSVPQEDLVGRAILVYWPFSRRWGRID